MYQYIFTYNHYFLYRGAPIRVAYHPTPINTPTSINTPTHSISLPQSYVMHVYVH